MSAASKPSSAPAAELLATGSFFLDYRWYFLAVDGVRFEQPASNIELTEGEYAVLVGKWYHDSLSAGSSDWVSFALDVLSDSSGFRTFCQLNVEITSGHRYTLKQHWVLSLSSPDAVVLEDDSASSEAGPFDCYRYRDFCERYGASEGALCR